ncbi:MAG: aminotransferase class I/II-fold pyridoxal phosphate-dependent enzyme, partial [Limnobacter sp.]|nr:aminotransferase class I/II-fold pyridoxal phosphate-dependent enzyme [Limnobacter sp.]
KAFIQTAGGIPHPLSVQEAHNFEPGLDDIAHAFASGVKGLLLASPSNPTGTRISQNRLKQILAICQAQERFLILDEIYQELVYDSPASSLLELAGAPTRDNPFVVINSFSKFFGMTGLRLGWMVLPPQLLAPIEKLAQNLAICPNTPAQVAALDCFTPEVLGLCEQRRLAFAERRQYLLEHLPRVGLDFSSQPDGAFYFYLKSPYHSDQYCMDLLEQTGVCTVPGKDFSASQGGRMFRISYANSLENIKKALELIEGFHQKLR